MRSIPNRIAVLGADGRRVRDLHRADTRNLSEADCDQLIVDHLDLIAETLRDAAIIPATSELRFLGRQIRRIDVLCAEIDTKTDELRRLVLIEDKLFRNPESRRQVVAQILDYAVTLDGLDAQALLEELDAGAQDLLEDQAAEIRRILGTADYLLLIVGDDVQASAAQLVQRMAVDRDPLSRTDVAMLALSMYQDGDRRLLVPNVVGGVIGAQRELRIRVEVAQGGQRLDVTGIAVGDSAQEEVPARLRAQSEDEFFASDAWSNHEEEARQYREFLRALVEAGIPGLRLGTTDSGRPTVHLDNTRVGKLKVFATMSKRRGLWDSVVARNAMLVASDEGTKAGLDDVRRELVQLGFEQQTSGRVVADVPTIIAHQAEVIAAIRRFAGRVTVHAAGE